MTKKEITPADILPPAEYAKRRAAMRAEIVAKKKNRRLEVGPVALNTSSRLITIFTGRLALRDKASATGSMKTVVLPPKPPPISDAVTRSLEMSMPSSRAQVSRTMKWPWVQTHSSPWPSSQNSPFSRLERGSR